MPTRTYLITGSTGIGAETARQLADLGNNLFIVSRTAEHVATLQKELEHLGAKTGSHVGDLTDTKVGPAAVKKCVKLFGRLDGLFNVAGISARAYGDAPLHECTEEGWRMVFATNVTTQYRMCREALLVMLAQTPDPNNGQRGVILNMTSILGIHPEPKHFATIGYASSKGAIITMTRTAAAYYAKEKIRLNALAPALANTPMSARAAKNLEIIEYISQKQPLTEGVIPVEDIAAAAFFLLTDASRSITGEVLEVDAGWNLC